MLFSSRYFCAIENHNFQYLSQLIWCFVRFAPMPLCHFCNSLFLIPRLLMLLCTSIEAINFIFCTVVNCILCDFDINWGGFLNDGGFDFEF